MRPIRPALLAFILGACWSLGGTAGAAIAALRVAPNTTVPAAATPETPATDATLDGHRPKVLLTEGPEGSVNQAGTKGAAAVPGTAPVGQHAPLVQVSGSAARLKLSEFESAEVENELYGVGGHHRACDACLTQLCGAAHGIDQSTCFSCIAANVRLASICQLA